MVISAQNARYVIIVAVCVHFMAISVFVNNLKLWTSFSLSTIATKEYPVGGQCFLESAAQILYIIFDFISKQFLSTDLKCARKHLLLLLFSKYKWNSSQLRETDVWLSWKIFPVIKTDILRYFRNFQISQFSYKWPCLWTFSTPLEKMAKL